MKRIQSWKRFVKNVVTPTWFVKLMFIYTCIIIIYFMSHLKLTFPLLKINKYKNISMNNMQKRDST